MRGWRKFLIAGATLNAAFILALLGKLTGDFVTVAVAVVGAYSAANAVTHVATVRKGDPTA